MSTVVMLGPGDHGRPMTREEFEAAHAQEGHRYELIGGKVYVSPVPNLPHDRVWDWVYGAIRDYSRSHPEVVNYVTGGARVIVPQAEGETIPEPDLAAYLNFPRHLSLADVAWDDVSPFLVAEIVSEFRPEKDLVRNVELYLRVPSVREYWVLDPRADPDRPTLTVYRRRGRRWQKPIAVAPGETYATGLLPGFVLVLDPRG